MIFKHSIKSIIRTPKKSILFLFLLILLAVFLSIGAGMYASARNMQKEADKIFTSVVELDYSADRTSEDESFYRKINSDLENFNFNKLKDHPAVKAVDMEKTAWAYIEGDAVKRTDSPLSDYVMVKVGNIIKYEGDLYIGIANEILFGKRVRKNAYVIISGRNDQGISMNYDFDSHHEYLIIGRISSEKSPTPVISPEIPEPADNIQELVDLTDYPDYFLSGPGKRTANLQEAMKEADSSLPVTMVTSLEASAPYSNREILMKEGRIFTPSEYGEDSNKVILMSEAVAGFYKVHTGDKINLKLHYNSSGTGTSDILADFKFDYEDTYEVVGIFQNKENNKYMIYMPEDSRIQQKFHSASLARYMVKNGTGAEFMEENKDGLVPGMEFTLYDQGYEEAVKPVNALKMSALIILVLASLSGIAILLLFSYLYTYKQKDTLKTMLSLGSGRRRTINYILYGAVILLVSSASAGAAVTSVFLNKLIGLFFESAQSTYGSDLRYSERSIGLQMNFIPQVKISPWLPVLVIAAVVMLGFLLLLSFTYVILRENSQVPPGKGSKKEKVNASVKRKAGKISFGRVRPVSLKFALVSLTRTKGRSLLVPAISLILSVFIVFLSLLTSTQQDKLNTVYDRIPVTAYMTSYRDETRDVGGLNLQYDIYRLFDPDYSYRVQDEDIYEDTMKNGEYTSLKAQEERERILDASEYFDKMYLYRAVHYEYMGVARTKEGKADEKLPLVPDIRVHNNNYGYDWFLNKMNQMSELAYTDDLRYAPYFLDDPEPEAEFLEGYDFDSLRLPENIGMISQSFAAEHGIRNGDTIRLTAWFSYEGEAVCSVMDIKVAGIYHEKWRSGTIYMPWIVSYDHNYYLDSSYTAGNGEDKRKIWNELLPRDVQAATFTLKNTDKLSELKDYLETRGYSQVGKLGSIRKVIVIQDKHLEETVQNLNNHIRLYHILEPVMLLLFGIIGFALSYLLIRHRMNELGIMRSMGARKRQVFFSFFLEQLILFLAGLVPTVVYAFIRPDKAGIYGGALMYFIICYLLGSALALIIMGRDRITDILFTKE